MLKLENKKTNVTFTAKVIIDHKMPNVNTDKWNKRKVNIGGVQTTVSARNGGSYFERDGVNYYIATPEFKVVKSVSIVRLKETGQKVDAKSPKPKLKVVVKKDEPKTEESSDSSSEPEEIEVKSIGLEKLGEHNYNCISRGVAAKGTYDPSVIFEIFEDDLLANETSDVYDFLNWVNENGKQMGRGTYEQIFAQYKAATK